MILGSLERFAVKWEVCVRSDAQIHGRFALVIGGEEVGDYSDPSTYLIGCYHWIRGFVEESLNRFEPGLFEMDKALVYRDLVDRLYDSDQPVGEVYRNTYGRFHLQHIGMSSMDGDFLLLVQNEAGESRFIWTKRSQDQIHEAHVAAGEVEAVFSEFLVKAAPDLPVKQPRSPDCGRKE